MSTHGQESGGGAAGLILFVIAAYFIYTNFFGENSGCDQYASEYSCEYVEKKATYQVWYWFNVRDGDKEDDRYIGTATGLGACRATAFRYHQANESFRSWNPRSYICILMKDGKKAEKHR